MRTLVLNAGYEPMQLISWQRALCLVLSQKAEVIAQYDAVVRSVSTAVHLPSVVRLVRYVQVVSRFGFVRCTRKNVLLRDHFQCQYCGVRCREGAISIDHVMPRSRAGKTSWTNVVAACHACNRKKGAMTPEEARMPLLKKPRRPTWRDLIGDLSRAGAGADWLPFLSETG